MRDSATDKRQRRPRPIAVVMVFGLFAILVLLLLTAAPSLLAAGANNAAALSLVSEWEATAQQVTLPECGEYPAKSVAAPALTKALHWDAEHGRALLNQGRVAWLAGDCAAARESWQQSLLAVPGDQIAAFWLFWAMGGDASDLPEGLSPERLARYAYYGGQRAEAAKTWDVMEAWYRLSLELSPDRTAAERLAWLYRRQGRDDEAAAMWRRLTRRFAANSADYWWAVGSAAELGQDWEQAAWAYGKGSGPAEHPYIFWIRQGAAYERLQRWSEAEAAYGQALAARSDLVLPYLSLGHLQRNREKYQQALEWYRKAGSVAAGEVGPLYYQGLVYFLLEEDLQAHDLLERALAVNPGDVMANYYLAQTLYRLGDLSGATALLARAVDLHLGEPWQWAMQLGDWRLALGERDEALAAYLRALEWNAGDAELEERIGALGEKE